MSSLANESLKFLLKNKKHDKVKLILEKISKTNKTKFELEEWESFMNRV